MNSDRQCLVILDCVPTITKSIAEALKAVECVNVELDVVVHPPQTYDRRDAFIKKTDKRLRHDPQAYLNINRKQYRRRY